MERRAFLRSGLAATILAPSTLSLPDLALGTPTLRRQARSPIKLSSNENALGLPEGARRAIIDALAVGNRYTGSTAGITERLARKHGVPAETILLGNGSTEILQMVAQAAAVGGRNARLIVADPTYEAVPRDAAAMGAEVVKVPLRHDYTHDLDRMHEAATSSRGPVLVFICNPNNPTGTLTSCDAISQWIRSAPENVWFLVDEAYFEFVTDPAYRTFIPDALARPNLIVSRTFSKIYAMAGVRLGYGIMHPETIKRVEPFGARNNLNQFALAAGLASLDDDAFVRKSLEVNAKSKQLTYQTLKDLDIEYLPTQANFMMHRIQGELQTYNDRMRAEGLLVGRAFAPMVSYSRVSFGLPEEMEVWATALRKFRKQGWA